MKELKCYCGKEREEQMNRILDQSADLFALGECSAASIVLARNLLIELLNCSDPLLLVSTINALEKAREFNACHALYRLIQSLEGRRKDLFFQNLLSISEQVETVQVNSDNEAALHFFQAREPVYPNSLPNEGLITPLIFDGHSPASLKHAWDFWDRIIEGAVTDTWKEMNTSANKEAGDNLIELKRGSECAQD